MNEADALKTVCKYLCVGGYPVMTFFLIVLILVVIAAVLYSKSKKTSAIPAEQRQPDASKGKTVTGPDGKTYVVPRSLGKAAKMAKEATEGSVYQLMCARQAADIGYEMFQKNDLIGDPENDMMDADVFFEQCFNAALFCRRGREGSYAPDPSKSVHYYEIFVEVAMAMADKNWFKAHDLHLLFYAWERLAYAYSGGEGCPVQVEKAKEYFKNAFTSAASTSYSLDPVETQVRIVQHMLGGYPRPAATYGLLAFQFIKDMVERGLIEGAALMEEYLHFIRDKEEQLGYSAKRDFALYYKGAKEDNNVYACYKLGECYYKGIGTEKNEAQGLRLLQAAAESGSLSAATMLLEIDSANKEKWERLIDEIRASLASHLQVMQGVTGVAAEQPKALHIDLPDEEEFEEEEESSSFSTKEDTRVDDEYQKDHDLSRMPNIIYDDSNNRWHLQHRNRDTAVYHNDEGQEVTIYHGQISGTSAQTSAGSFHWY